jgi:hypothetical protein
VQPPPDEADQSDNLLQFNLGSRRKSARGQASSAAAAAADASASATTATSEATGADAAIATTEAAAPVTTTSEESDSRATLVPIVEEPRAAAAAGGEAADKATEPAKLDKGKEKVGDAEADTAHMETVEENEQEGNEKQKPKPKKKQQQKQKEKVVDEDEDDEDYEVEEDEDDDEEEEEEEEKGNALAESDDAGERAMTHDSDDAPLEPQRDTSVFEAIVNAITLEAYFELVLKVRRTTPTAADAHSVVLTGTQCSHSRSTGLQIVGGAGAAHGRGGNRQGPAHVQVHGEGPAGSAPLPLRRCGVRPRRFRGGVRGHSTHLSAQPAVHPGLEFAQHRDHQVPRASLELRRSQSHCDPN